MRAVLPSLILLMPLAACGQSTAGDNVREAYDNRADAIDRQAATQPTPTAKKIYRARADAIREEGKDREKGLEGKEPSAGPAGEASGGGSPQG